MNRLFLHALALAGVMVAPGMGTAHAERTSWRRIPAVPGIVRLSPADRGLRADAHARLYRAESFYTPPVVHRRREVWSAPRFPAGYGYDSYWSGYGSSGYGYGSTGYGYGGDFSEAYTHDFEQGQTVGYATRSGAYGGQPIDAGSYYGSGYGYGSRSGWSPPIPPAGGLAAYSPGAYGPGPRIVRIPTHYAPFHDTFGGCHCSSKGY